MALTYAVNLQAKKTKTDKLSLGVAQRAGHVVTTVVSFTKIIIMEQPHY